MEGTGTIEAPDGDYEHVTAEGGAHEEAKAVLEALIPEGHKLIAIRTL